MENQMHPLKPLQSQLTLCKGRFVNFFFLSSEKVVLMYNVNITFSPHFLCIFFILIFNTVRLGEWVVGVTRYKNKLI